MEDYQIAEGEPDIRGWHVVAADGRRLGEVESLIVDTAAMQVRYVLMDPDDDVFRDNDDRLLPLPLGAAHLDENDNEVVLDTLTADMLASAPRLKKGGLTAEGESELRTYYLSRLRGRSVAGNGPFSDRDLYNHTRFFGRRWAGPENAPYLTSRRRRSVEREVPISRETASESVRERSTASDRVERSAGPEEDRPLR